MEVSNEEPWEHPARSREPVQGLLARAQDRHLRCDHHFLHDLGACRMAYALGAASRRELIGVHPDLVRVVERAIEITRCDFTVHDGIRTVEEQKRFVAQGVSKTMRSKHLEGKAVDLVPWVEGKPRWWWPQIYQIAAAMHQAARELGVRIRWGVVWDRRLNDLAPGIDDPDLLADALRREGLAYNARHPGPDFPDGPHYEVLT